jgi:anti-sigma B factor antagonist
VGRIISPKPYQCSNKVIGRRRIYPGIVLRRNELDAPRFTAGSNKVFHKGSKTVTFRKENKNMVLKVTITLKETGVFVVKPAGEIDSGTYAELEKAIKPLLIPTTKAIIFDMGSVTFISSMGLSVIFKTKEALEKNRGTVVITNPQPQIKKVFEMVKVIPEYLFASMEEADLYLDRFLTEMEKES